MAINAEVHVGDATYKGVIEEGQVHIKGAEIEIKEIRKVDNYGPGRQRIVLKNGTELLYSAEEASGVLSIAVPGMSDTVYVDFPAVKTLRTDLP